MKTIEDQNRLQVEAIIIQDKRMTEKIELLPCPFCGENPDLDGEQGTQLNIFCSNCGVNMELQKSDILTLEERDTWNNTTFQHSEEVELKCYNILADRWNNRKLIYKSITQDKK